jgi:serine/threonine protein kinase
MSYVPYDIPCFLLFLLASARKSMLQWPTRLTIIQRVARGIMYLHHDSRLTVIHRDLKASNILLDKEMEPKKISDFGMDMIFSGDQLQANTNRVVGIWGCLNSLELIVSS